MGGVADIEKVSEDLWNKSLNGVRYRKKNSRYAKYSLLGDLFGFVRIRFIGRIYLDDGLVMYYLSYRLGKKK